MNALIRLKSRVLSRRSRPSAPCILDRVPIEVLEPIYVLACTDGGLTGRSLALVSKSIRETSRAARFTSVSLCSGLPNQIAIFLSHYFIERTRPSSTTPKVRHLCLASAQYVGRVKTDPYTRSVSDAEQQKYTQNILALISLVAPDLYTLSLICGEMDWRTELEFPNIGTTGFPLLEELSLIGYGLEFAPVHNTDWRPDEGEDAAYDSSLHPPLPRLTRLHIACSARDSSSAMGLRCWADRAPGITHLRLTNIDRYSFGRISKYMKELVEVETRSIFKYMDLLVLQPSAPPALGGRCGNPYIEYSEFKARLEELHLSGTRRWALLPPYMAAASRKKLTRSSRKEWLDRLAGGPGCWSIEESSFIAERR